MFTIDNLPFGIFSTPGTSPRAGVAYRDWIVDLPALARVLRFDFAVATLSAPVLNDFIALGRAVTGGARTQVQGWLRNALPADHPAVFVRRAGATLHLPVRVGDYTDFYSSLDHATNVGRLFRDPANALLPNWRHLPVGYHGRASSIVVSGIPVRRPQGQVLPAGSERPVFRPTAKLDYELEVACVIGRENPLGEPVPVDRAEDYVFGLLLFNDWSARDIQSWEYRPLGPFLGKSFASSVSPWIVPLEALEPFRTAGPVQEPPPLPHLRSDGPAAFDVALSARLTDAAGASGELASVNFGQLYWSIRQQIAHHTSNGCNLRVGDLLASGTVSGPEPTAMGSLLERSANGSRPVEVAPGLRRTFLEDGDTLTLGGVARRDGLEIDFGEVSATVLPAHES